MQKFSGIWRPHSLDNLYRDYVEGVFIPSIDVVKRTDNGHYEASFQNLKVTHFDQAEAINRLTAQIQEGLLKGEIHPGS